MNRTEAMQAMLNGHAVEADDDLMYHRHRKHGGFYQFRWHAHRIEINLNKEKPEWKFSRSRFFLSHKFKVSQ